MSQQTALYLTAKVGNMKQQSESQSVTEAQKNIITHAIVEHG